MKHLPKHLRPRYRYLGVAVESWPDAVIDRRTFQRHLWYAAQNLLGEADSAALDLSVLRFQLEDGAGEAVVRTRRGEVDRARAALSCVDEIDGHELGLRVRGTSGTVRACEEKYIRSGPEERGKREVAFEGADRLAVVRSDRYDVRVDSAFAGATALDL